MQISNSVDVLGEDPTELAAKRAAAQQRAAMAKRHAQSLEDSGASPEEIKEAWENVDIQTERAQTENLLGRIYKKEGVNWLLLAALGAGAYFLLKG